MDSLEISAFIPASQQVLYKAWLSSEMHGAMTGTECQIDPSVGGKFSVSDGYIIGVNQELEPYRKIVQSWRTADFPDKSKDSRLEVLLASAGGGTNITLLHSDIPTGQGEMYREGWQEYYFDPMIEYFKQTVK